MSPRNEAGLAALLLCIGAVAGCGKESPARAIYETAHELEHEDAEGACDRLFPNTLLPVEIAAALGVPQGEHPRTTLWDRERAKCVRELGHAGDYASFSFEEPRVRTIQPIAVSARDGITAASRALVALRGDSPRTINLIEFRGVWRIVITLHSSD
jgi:hypothetical protein